LLSENPSFKSISAKSKPNIVKELGEESASDKTEGAPNKNLARDFKLRHSVLFYKILTVGFYYA